VWSSDESIRYDGSTDRNINHSGYVNLGGTFSITNSEEMLENFGSQFLKYLLINAQLYSFLLFTRITRFIFHQFIFNKHPNFSWGYTAVYNGKKRKVELCVVLSRRYSISFQHSIITRLLSLYIYYRLTVHTQIKVINILPMSSYKQQRSSPILTRAGTKAALRKQFDNEVIDAFGVTALVGYEAEVNHCIGLCTATYSDYHFHMALASVDTFKYRTHQKHRLIYACIQGNVKWFTRLWKAGNVEDMIQLRRRSDEVKPPLFRHAFSGPENLAYHLFDNAQEDRGKEPSTDTLNRLTILRILFVSPISMMEVDRASEDDQPIWKGSLNLTISSKKYTLSHELLQHPNRIDPNKPDFLPPIVTVAKKDFWEIGIELANLPNLNLNVRC
jgi:hypothetical protein